MIWESRLSTRPRRCHARYRMLRRLNLRRKLEWQIFDHSRVRLRARAWRQLFYDTQYNIYANVSDYSGADRL